MLSKEKITILIPTKNRADFLRRLLRYLANAGYQHWIFIGDSSNDLHLAETRKTIESLKDRLKIKHFECPGLNVSETIEHMNQFITTPYCVFSADDDLLSVRGVDRCVDFLESNPNYGVANGVGIATSLESGPYGNISYVHYYQQIGLDADSGSQRLRDYFTVGPYTLLHCVHRTPDWQELNKGFKNMPWARQGFIFDGLTSSVTSAIRNKVKRVDCLYLMRFGHDRIYSQVYAYDWFTNQDWYPGFKDLHDRAIDELIKHDGISENKAEEAFRQAFWPYLARMFSRGLPPPGPGMLGRLKNIAGKIPGAKAVYEHIIPHIQAKGETNLLPLLVKPTSPYHEDFMPMYRAITIPIKVENNGK